MVSSSLFFYFWPSSSSPGALWVPKILVRGQLALSQYRMSLRQTGSVVFLPWKAEGKMKHKCHSWISTEWLRLKRNIRRKYNQHLEDCKSEGLVAEKSMIWRYSKYVKVCQRFSPYNSYNFKSLTTWSTWPILICKWCSDFVIPSNHFVYNVIKHAEILTQYTGGLVFPLSAIMDQWVIQFKGRTCCIRLTSFSPASSGSSGI